MYVDKNINKYVYLTTKIIVLCLHTQLCISGPGSRAWLLWEGRGRLEVLLGSLLLHVLLNILHHAAELNKRRSVLRPVGQYVWSGSQAWGVSTIHVDIHKLHTCTCRWYDRTGLSHSI